MGADRVAWGKRAALLLLILGLAAILLPGPQADRRLAGRTRVIFWHPYAGEWQPIYEDAVRRFNESQDKYEVVPYVVPDVAMTTKFLLSAAGGSTPDLLHEWGPVMGMWTEKRLIRPWDDVMTADERAKFYRDTYPIVQKHSVYHGKVMGLVDGLDLYAVYYRLDHLAELGVDKNNLPKTLEDLVALGKRLDRYDSHGRLTRMGFMPQGFTNYVAAFGGSFNEGDRIVVDTPENVRALTFLRDNIKRVGYANYTRFTSGLAADAGPTMPLIAGNYSIMYDGEWRVKQVAQYAPDTPYVVEPLPPPKLGRPNASISAPNFLYLPTRAVNPKGAWEFAKFLVGFMHPEDGGKNMGDMGWLPDDPEIARSRSYQRYLQKYPQYQTYVDLMSSPNLAIPPRGTLQAFATDQINRADDDVMRGLKTPEQALREVDASDVRELERQHRLGHMEGGAP